MMKGPQKLPFQSAVMPVVSCCRMIARLATRLRRLQRSSCAYRKTFRSTHGRDGTPRGPPRVRCLHALWWINFCRGWEMAECFLRPRVLLMAAAWRPQHVHDTRWAVDIGLSLCLCRHTDEQPTEVPSRVRCFHFTDTAALGYQHRHGLAESQFREKPNRTTWSYPDCPNTGRNAMALPTAAYLVSGVAHRVDLQVKHLLRHLCICCLESFCRLCEPAVVRDSEAAPLTE